MLCQFTARTSMKALITGANRGLGLNLTKFLANKNYIVHSTARNISELTPFSDTCYYHKLDLSNSSAEEIKEIFLKNGPFDVIVHCASPYDISTKMTDVSIELLGTFYKCMAADQLIVDLAYKNLTENGKLLVAGAIIAEDMFIGQVGMSGMHKANLRRISKEYNKLSESENKKSYIKYLNLGTFRETIECEEDGLSVAQVIDKINNIIQSPEQFKHNVDIISNCEFDKYYPNQLNTNQNII